MTSPLIHIGARKKWLYLKCSGHPSFFSVGIVHILWSRVYLAEIGTQFVVCCTQCVRLLYECVKELWNLSMVSFPPVPKFCI